MRNIVISENEAGQRADKFLHKYLKEASSGFLYKMMRKKNITLNKKKITGSELLQLHDEIQLFMAEETIEKFRGQAAAGMDLQEYEKAYEKLKGISVLFQDENILLVNKPAGILSQKAEQGDLSVNEWLIGYLLHQNSIKEEQLLTFKPSVCNRLDRNTSGIVICGVSLAGTQKMNEMLKNRELHKYYRLFVHGKMTEEETVRGFLWKDEKSNRVTIYTKERQDASYIETRYIPLAYERKLDMTYLEVELLTGKPHQIRAHLASLSHGLAGDYKYGKKQDCQKDKERFGISSQLLHAYRLEFPIMEQPRWETLSEKEITAELPVIFQHILEQYDFS